MTASLPQLTPTAAGSTGSGKLQSPKRPATPPTASRWFWRAVGISGAVALWWLATTVVWSANPVLSNMGPAATMGALWDGLINGNLIADLRASLWRLGVGLGIAVAIGGPLGIALGTNATFDVATAPVINFIRMISPLAWAPVVIVAFGVGTTPVLFLIAITAVWPVALGTAAGVRSVSPGWQAVATSLGASRTERFRFVTFPAIRGNVLVSLRMALGVAWIVLVPAEMLGVDSGLGYAVLNARDQLNYPGLAAAVVLIGTTGFVLDAIFRRVLAIDPRSAG